MGEGGGSYNIKSAVMSMGASSSRAQQKIWLRCQRRSILLKMCAVQGMAIWPRCQRSILLKMCAVQGMAIWPWCQRRKRVLFKVWQFGQGVKEENVCCSRYGNLAEVSKKKYIPENVSCSRYDNNLQKCELFKVRQQSSKCELFKV